MSEEIEFVGWADHEGHVWTGDHAEARARNYFSDLIARPYSLRPVYAVKCGERHFDENGEEA